MKKLYLLFVTACLFSQVLFAKDFTEEEIRKNLPKLLGSTGYGREFYFSVIPGLETEGEANEIKIYVSSGVSTDVKVEVDGKGFQQIKTTIPNDIIEFTLAPQIAQVYRKADNEAPQAEKIWEEAGIHVIAGDPIVCYVVTRYHNSSDGFLAIEAQALGKEYIVASYADAGNNISAWRTSYVAITAAYDKTKLTFTMGGTDWSKTAGGQLPGETTNWTIEHAGDVLLIGSLGSYADLSGSKILATKPVSVVSGNFCANVPANLGQCDFITEMELPTHTWGTEYHVAPFIERKKNPIVKIFAKEPKTKIYRDGNQIGFIRTAGGVDGVGYLSMRTDEGNPRPVVISGDNAISVTQFNSSAEDDNVPSAPFQVVLTPIEQYQREVVFNTPGIRGGRGFDKNYINLCYEATESGTIPDDMEFAEVVGGDFSWQKLADISPNPGSPFNQIEGGKIYYSKTMLLSGDGVYRIRSSKPYAAYIYGFSDNESYGFPAAVGLRDMTINDTIPPKPEWEMDCQGNVNFTQDHSVIDMPEDPENRSNMSTIYMHSDVSYNYKLYHGDFMPCEDQSFAWSLESIDPTEGALAVVTFADCAGNDTTLYIDYHAPKVKLVEKEWNCGILNVGDTAWKEFHLYNYGTGSYICKAINLKQKDIKGKPQGFTLWNEEREAEIYNQFLSIEILPDDTLHFWVKFEATEEGRFWDSLGYGDTCFFRFKAYLEAQVGSPLIQVSDWEFPATNVGGTAYGEINVKNIGTIDLEIYGYDGMKLFGQKSGVSIFTSMDLEQMDISESNPWIIEPNVEHTISVEFAPDDSITFMDSIVFTSNTTESSIDSIGYLSGTGINVISVSEYNSKLRIYPNPVDDVLVIENVVTGLRHVSEDVEIYDVLGRIDRPPVNLTPALSQGEGVIRLDVSHLQPGSYFIRVGDEFLKFIKM